MFGPLDILFENFVSLKLGSNSRFAIDRVFSERHVERNLRIETHLSEIMCGIVSSGYGLAICDPFTAVEFSQRNVVLRPFKPDIPFEFGVLLPSGENLERVAQDYVNEFIQYLKYEMRDYLYESV